MGRIRTIKPGFWTNEDLSALPEATHMLAAALLNYADDEGYFNANVGLIKSECCPLREPSVSIHDSLIALSKIGWIRLGSASDGKRYGQVTKFSDHQRVNRPTASKIKALDVVWECSLTTHAQLTEPSSPERKGREEERKEGSVAKATGAEAPVDLNDTEATKRACYAIAKQIGRRSAPTELLRTGRSWAEIYAVLVTAQSKADPPSYLAWACRDAKPRDAPVEKFDPDADPDSIRRRRMIEAARERAAS